MEDVRVRLRRLDDAEEVERIYREVHPKPRTDHPWHALIVLVAEHEGRIIGYSSAVLAGKTFYLSETLVRPEYQGRGIGRRLMDARLELGTKLCAVEAIGGVDPDHEVMKHLLVSQGFSPDPDIDQAILGPGRVGYTRVLGGWQ